MIALAWYVGDSIRIYVEIENGILKKVRHETIGCLYAIACAEAVSTLTELKYSESNWNILNEKVLEYLESVPANKKHCVSMAVNAFKTALKDAGVQGIHFDNEYKSFLRAFPGSAVSKITQTSEQKRHRIAELFTEFIMPELREQGITAELRSADIPKKLVCIALKNAKDDQPKNFIENILRKFIDKKLSIKCIP